MDNLIIADLYRYVPEQYRCLNLFKGFRSPGFRFMFFKRKIDACKKNSLKWFLLKVIVRHYSYKYGFQIGGKIGKGFYISHFGIIVVSPEAIIGDNCNVAHGVTIGVTRRGKKIGAPTIGNCVWIGTGSIIVGKINIGDNVLIAPGSFVNVNVPSNSIVIGNPCIIKPNLNATDRYINNIYWG
jgi:serine O-acetyltransferase